MPFYEYECGNCGVKIERFQKITDTHLVTCPECSANSLKRLVSAAGFVLKGTGWYATDFKNKPDKSAGKSQNNDKSSAADTKCTPVSSEATTATKRE